MVTALERANVTVVVTRDWTEGRHAALLKILDTDATHVHYVDFDRLLHWLELYPEELKNTVARVERCDCLIVGRTARAATIVTTLNTLGIPVTFEAVLAEAAGGAVGRPHVARALMAGGWVAEIREAFDKWLGAGRPAFVEKPRLEVADGVTLIHQAGGLAIWAHPGGDGRRARFERMVAAGIDGAEVRHPGHDASDQARIGALVEFFNLVPSGGSDWHGIMAGPRMLGAVQVPSEWLERHEERLAMRRRAVPVREE